MKEKTPSLRGRMASAFLAAMATEDGSLLPANAVRSLARAAAEMRPTQTPRDARQILVREAIALYRAIGKRDKTEASRWLQAQEPGTRGALIAARVLPRGTKMTAEAKMDFRHLLGLVRRLSHPGLASLVEAGEDEGLAYLLIRLIQGARPLTEWLRKGRPWNNADGIKIVLQAADGLGYAHALGLFHGALNSDQVFINDKGQVIVRGVGLSQLSNTLGAAVPRIRTLFTAPEIIAGAPGDARSDVYALGALLYVLLARRGPAREGNVLTPASQFTPSVWPALDEVVEKALSLYPDQRFVNAHEFAWALRLAARGVRMTGPQPKHETVPAARVASPSAGMPAQAAMPATIDIRAEGVFPAAAPMPQVDLSPLQASAFTFGNLLMAAVEMPTPPPIPTIDWDALLAPLPSRN